jgi:hypothetical protein
MRAKKTRKTKPARAKPAGAVDPIFALIEAHKVAFMRRMAASAALFDVPDTSKRHKALVAADNKARDVDEDAAFKLITVEPTTMAGVLALINYVEAFNQQKFQYKKGWNSAPYNWPDASQFEFEGINDDPDGDCGMAFAILINVRDALKTLAAQS